MATMSFFSLYRGKREEGKGEEGEKRGGESKGRGGEEREEGSQMVHLATAWRRLLVITACNTQSVAAL